MKLTLVAPEKRLLVGQEVTEVTVPAFKGELNILPGHEPMVTTLVPGVIRYKVKDGKEQAASINWGYCNISPDGINVLAEMVETASEIDFNAVRNQIAQAEMKMLTETLDDRSWKELQGFLAHSKARLRLQGQ